jgi:hypothetical protein
VTSTFPALYIGIVTVYWRRVCYHLQLTEAFSIMLLLNAAINNSRIIKDCFSIHGEVQFVGNKLIYMSVICLFVCLSCRVCTRQRYLGPYVSPSSGFNKKTVITFQENSKAFHFQYFNIYFQTVK